MIFFFLLLLLLSSLSPTSQSIFICRTASVLDIRVFYLFYLEQINQTNDKHNKSVNNYIRFRDVELFYLFDWNARLVLEYFHWKSIKIQFSSVTSISQFQIKQLQSLALVLLLVSIIVIAYVLCACIEKNNPKIMDISKLCKYIHKHTPGKKKYTIAFTQLIFHQHTYAIASKSNFI